MLSRRLIRVKVMQVIYAHLQQGSLDLREADKTLQHSIEKSQDLYYLLLQLPSALRRVAAKRIELGQQKIRPTEEERNPNTRFATNKFIAQIEENEELNNYISATGNTWAQDESLVKTLFAKMTHTKLYEKYMAAALGDFIADKDFVVRFMSKELPQMPVFFSSIELKNVFWNDEAEFMLSIAVKTLKDFDGTNGQSVPLVPLFKNSDDEEFSHLLLRKSFAERDNTIELIKKYSKNWDADRVATLDIILTQMAIAEMTSMVNIPIKVTINEYIEISKFYSTPKSHSYINGLLQKIVRDLVEEGRISEAQLF